MKTSANDALRYFVAAAAAVGALLLNDVTSFVSKRPLFTAAEARVGRPLTPMSYAGVARRTTRRAAVVGGAAVAAGAGAYYYSRGCYQTTNAYGQTVRRCR